MSQKIMDIIPKEFHPGLIKEVEELQQAEKKQAEEKEKSEKKVSPEMEAYLERKKDATK